MLYKTSIDESQLPDGYDLNSGQGAYPETQGYFTFGSSGFLYRSNKLMYDRNTDTLWHQLLGTPAFGRLVGSGIELERLPVTLTTWEAWYEAHPDTKVMAFETGFSRDYSLGAAYADYFASPGTMFPVWQRSRELPTKSWVFTQLIDDVPKAYPLDTLEAEWVINDSLAGQDLVVIYDKGGHGAKAYERSTYIFTPSQSEPVQLIIDEQGRNWRITENALVGPTGEQLARLPGHMAYWFGWFSFYPKTAIYGVD